ncbi:MAG: biopolymer transporter ExbD [Gemmataceae bacterium]
MSVEKRRFLDVWIVESNTIYQEVPYDVVVDWLGQGRLLDDDYTRRSGTADWQRIGQTPELRPFSLSNRSNQSEAGSAEVPEDKAELLEPAEVDYVGPPRRLYESEDDDVDMIPLIDVSLVLLIFFMMTATTVGAAAFVPTPRSDYGQTVDDPNGIRIDIEIDPTTGNPLYAVAEGNKPAAPDDRDLDSLPALLTRLKALLETRTTPANLTINAHKDLKAKYARDLILGLRAEPYRSKLSENFLGVSQE